MLQCLYCTVPFFSIGDTCTRVITTSIHTLTDNGFLSTYRVHHLASEFHWNSTETTGVQCNLPRRRTSWVSLSPWSLLNYHSHSVATNKLSRERNVDEWEREKMKSRVRGAIKGAKEKKKKCCFENTGKTVEVCFSKNATVWVMCHGWERNW